jgi:hypothetical protein
VNARARSSAPLLLTERLTAKHKLEVWELVAYAATRQCECKSEIACAPCRARAFYADLTGGVFGKDGRFVEFDESRRVRV